MGIFHFMARISLRALAEVLATGASLLALIFPACAAQGPGFHNAPASVRTMSNPVAGHDVAAGKTAYHIHCANCHGENAEGMGDVPALAKGATQSATDGELFWYITTGD